MTYRTSHLHVCGSTDSGKSKFLEYLIWKDMKAGHGGCLIDPHGTLYTALTRRLTGSGLERKVICLDPGHDTYAPGFNPLVTTDSTIDHVVETTIGAFLSVWGGNPNETPLLERCMRALFRALAENRLTLLEALELTHGIIDTRLIQNIKDPVCRAEWELFQSLSRRDFNTYFHSTQNRLARFLSSERIRNIVAQNRAVLDTRKIMDDGAFLLVNLSRSTNLHASQARLLGTLLINDFFNKVFQRRSSRPFYLYIDECSHFVIPDVANMLAECRKFGLYLTLSHQTLHQIQQAGVYEAVMGNARSKVVFGGLSYEDAKVMVENTQPDLLARDEINHTLDKPVTTGYRRTWLDIYTDTTSEGEGVSETSNDLTTETRQNTATESFGGHEALEPEIEWLPTSLRSLDDKRTKAVARLMGLPKRSCLLKPAKGKARFTRVPYVPRSVANDRRTVTYQIERIKQSGFARTIIEVQTEIKVRRTKVFHVEPLDRRDNDDFLS